MFELVTSVELFESYNPKYEDHLLLAFRFGSDDTWVPQCYIPLAKEVRFDEAQFMGLTRSEVSDLVNELLAKHVPEGVILPDRKLARA